MTVRTYNAMPSVKHELVLTYFENNVIEDSPALRDGCSSVS